jgi:hypothetical protein
MQSLRGATHGLHVEQIDLELALVVGPQREGAAPRVRGLNLLDAPVRHDAGRTEREPTGTRTRNVSCATEESLCSASKRMRRDRRTLEAADRSRNAIPFQGVHVERPGLSDGVRDVQFAARTLLADRGKMTAHSPA